MTLPTTWFLRVTENLTTASLCRSSKVLFSFSPELHRHHRMPAENLDVIWCISKVCIFYVANTAFYSHQFLFFLARVWLSASLCWLLSVVFSMLACLSSVIIREQDLLISVVCLWRGMAATASSGIQLKKWTSLLSVLLTATDKLSCSTCCLQQSS